MSGVSRAERRQLWVVRMQRFAGSGQTVVEFCKAENVSVPTYYYWKQKLSSAATEKPSNSISSKRKPTRAFTQLVVNDSQSQPTVSLPGGITIELGQNLELASAIVDRVVHHACSQQSDQRESARC